MRNGYALVPISTPELERRWAAVRAAMKEADIAVLLMYGTNDYMTGYIKYLTDVPCGFGYPTTLIFPADDEMTVVGHGPLQGDTAPGTASSYRGVKRILTTSSFVNASYTAGLDPEQAAKGLAPYVSSKIGVVGPMSMPMTMRDALAVNGFADTEFVDATDLVDRIKAIKSDEEIARIKETALLQDRTWLEVLGILRPGISENDVATEALYRMRLAGSEQGVYLCSSAPMGTCAPLRMPHDLGRVLQSGDQVNFLIETTGPGGLYTELGRTVVLGEADQKMRDEFDLVLKARNFALELFRPGATGAEIWQRCNEFLVSKGRQEERRLFFHGQGYDVVERPLMRPDEPMPLAVGMNMALHPSIVTPTSFTWICDNYLLMEAGPVRLHEAEERLFEA